MLKVKLMMISIFILFTVATAFAEGDLEAQLKDYFNKTVQKVRNADNPIDKRDILNKSFDNLIKAFNAAAELPLSDKDRAGVNYFRQKVIEKKNELNGLNGYNKVADANLNQFADYSMQQFEQSAEYITISVLTLILIIILVILLL